MTPRSVTGLVDALEADGWVARSPHPTDRRATVISLTPAAEQTLAKLNENYEDLARDLLGDVPADDLIWCRASISQLEERPTISSPGESRTSTKPTSTLVDEYSQALSPTDRRAAFADKAAYDSMRYA